MNHIIYSGLEKKCQDIVGWEKSRYSVISEMLLKAIDEVLNVTPNELKGRVRRREFVDARNMYCAIIRRTTHQTLTNIGASIGRNHSTVIHSIESHKTKLETDPAYLGAYTELLETITNQIEAKNVKEEY